MFRSAADGVDAVIQNVFGVGPVGIVAIMIFVLEIFTEDIPAALYFVLAGGIKDEERFFRRRFGGRRRK